MSKLFAGLVLTRLSWSLRKCVGFGVRMTYQGNIMRNQNPRCEIKIRVGAYECHIDDLSYPMSFCSVFGVYALEV